MKPKLLLVILGAILGIAAAHVWPRYIEPRLPTMLRSSAAAVDGVVVRKQLLDDRLLLTLDSNEGAALVTFTRQVAEIDLLIAEGDTVTLALGSYQPFVTDPTIEAVKKPDDEDSSQTSEPEIVPPAPQPDELSPQPLDESNEEIPPLPLEDDTDL